MVLKALGKMPTRRELLTVCSISIAKELKTVFRKPVGRAPWQQVGILRCCIFFKGFVVNCHVSQGISMFLIV